MNESARTRKLCEELRRRNAMVYAAVGSEKVAGWPDRYVHHSLWSGWLEFKIDSGKLTALQREVIVGLEERRRCSAFVVRFFSQDRKMRVEDCDGREIAVTDPQMLLETLRRVLWSGPYGRYYLDA